jgi:formylglycine-generating enzyme required for sulfatase activity
MLLDLLDGEPFVQPFGREQSVELNGEPLTTSRRLVDDDELRFFGSRIRIVAAEGSLILDVRLEDSAYVTQPPDSPGDTSHQEEEIIAPTAFQRVSETRGPVEKTHRHTLKIAVGAGLAVLMLTSYLLFSSSSIQITVDPADPDEVAIAGGWFRVPIGDRILMRPGEYTVTVERQGYYPASQSFSVGDEDSKTIEIGMRKLPGWLSVATQPGVDAIVTLDNVHIEKAPLGPVELEPGPHSVAVRADRYLPFSDVVDVRGLGLQGSIHVQLVPRWADVSMSSDPSGAAIFVGDNMVGRTPATVELIEGTHQISIVTEGYKAWDGAVVATANVAQDLPTVKLEPANAKLLVNSVPRGANVTVDGRYRGPSPITLSLAPDVNYQIGLSKAGYGATVRNVRLQAAASESIVVDLSARTGSVTVSVQPADASVYVDGLERGIGTTKLTLSTAPHKIEVRKPGYEAWSQSVTPRRGYPQTVSARLRSHKDIERAKIVNSYESPDGQTMRRVEPGTFRLGSSRAEPGRRANEVLVPVTLSSAYYISTREVTNKAFSDFDPAHDSGSEINPAMTGDVNPVANVTWAAAAQYCNWLSSKEGLTPVYREEFGEWVAIRPFPNGYRLPTEAEWAWALRFSAAPTATPFPWGSKMPPRVNSGNFAGRSASGFAPSVLLTYDDGYKTTAPVGKFPPNGLGLFDGAGNVAEWVNDIYSTPTPGLTNPLIDPLGPEHGKSNVVRGSSWRHAAVGQLRMSYRESSNQARPDVGFRIARNAE